MNFHHHHHIDPKSITLTGECTTARRKHDCDGEGNLPGTRDYVPGKEKILYVCTSGERLYACDNILQLIIGHGCVRGLRYLRMCSYRRCQSGWTRKSRGQVREEGKKLHRLKASQAGYSAQTSYSCMGLGDA